MFSFVPGLHLLLPHPPCNPTDTCCEICLLCARAAQSARKKCKKKKVRVFFFPLAVLRASVRFCPLTQSLTGADAVRSRDDDRSAVCPPSVHPGAIWRSSMIPLWRPAGCRSTGSQHGVRGPLRGLPAKPKTVSLLF